MLLTGNTDQRSRIRLRDDANKHPKDAERAGPPPVVRRLNSTATVVVVLLTLLTFSLGFYFVHALSSSHRTSQISSQFYHLQLELQDLSLKLSSVLVHLRKRQADGRQTELLINAIDDTASRIDEFASTLQPTVTKLCAILEHPPCVQRPLAEHLQKRLVKVLDRVDRIVPLFRSHNIEQHQIWRPSDELLIESVQRDLAALHSALNEYNVTRLREQLVVTVFMLLALLVVYWLTAVRLIRPMIKAVYRSFIRLSIRRRQSHHAANHDALTGLLNRRSFIRHLSLALKQHHNVALMVLDVDEFKRINDSMGHAAGDRVLVHIAQCLNSISDRSITAFRLGGDEFAICFKQQSANRRNIPDVAQELFNRVHMPLLIEHHTLHIKISAGIADGCDDLTSLNASADAALYRAKSLMGDQFVMAWEDWLLNNQGSVLKEQLPEALRNGQIQPHYQPIFCLQTEQLKGFEILARWEHQSEGVMSPEQWLNDIARYGLIYEFSESIASQTQLDWSHSESRQLICFNLHPALIEDPRTLKLFNQIIPQLKNAQLVAEISEEILVDPLALTMQRGLARLRELGIKLSLDDFGAGMGSLRNIAHLPLDFVKLDASFVHQVDKSTNIRKVVQAQIECLIDLNIEVIAEAVELESQAKILNSLGCQYAQGHHFSAAINRVAANQLIEKQHLSPHTKSRKNLDKEAL